MDAVTRAEIEAHTVKTPLEAPSTSLIWIGLCALVALVSTTLTLITLPSYLHVLNDPELYWRTYTRGFGVIAAVAIVSLFATVITTVGAIRRRGPYREQHASAAGQALQAEHDALVGPKSSAGLQVGGIILTVVFSFMLLFVVFGFATPVAFNLGFFIFELICLFFAGIFAAAMLTAASRRRAARRRIAARLAA